jgi:hypothetical protein
MALAFDCTLIRAWRANATAFAGLAARRDFGGFVMNF